MRAALLLALSACGAVSHEGEPHVCEAATEGELDDDGCVCAWTDEGGGDRQWFWDCDA